MLFPISAILALNAVSAVVGTSSNSLTSANVAQAAYALPKTELKFISNVVADTVNSHKIPGPEGVRVNVPILGRALRSSV